MASTFEHAVGKELQPARAGDELLVAHAKRGDAAAFGELANRHSSRLRRFLYRILRDCDAAYDAVQEALFKAWQNMHRFEGRSRFSTWLTSIGMNEAYAVLRKKHAEPIDPQDLAEQQTPDRSTQPDEVFESREFLAATGRALNELSEDYRVAVRLRDVQGLSTTEAAEIVGIGERAFKSRLHRGRMALREKLDGHFEPTAA